MSQPWPATLLAEASQCTEEQLAWYSSAGLLHRASPDAYAPDSLHRLQLIQHVKRRGITDEDLALAAKQQGDLLAAFEKFGPIGLSGQTMEGAAEAGGIPPQLREELLRLLGAEPADAATDDDVNALSILRQALDLSLPEEALVQLIRVFVDTTGRLADAEVRIFHDHVHEQLRAQGMEGRELLAATDSIAQPALELAEPAMLYFHRRAYDRAIRDDLLRHLAEATTAPAARPGEATGSVMFVDLAGFTPLTVTLGDSGVAEVLQGFASIIRREADLHGGRIIKQIGDAFMLVFDRPVDAVACGLKAIQRCREDQELPPLHVGLHHGPLLYRDGDYFGNTVNLAARVTSASDGGQFLVTHPVVAAVPDEVAQFALLPARPLKGVLDPPPLYACQQPTGGLGG